MPPGETRHIVWNPLADAPGNTGCDFRVRITAQTAGGDVGQGESDSFCISDDPPQLPTDTLQIGQLTISAVTITQAGDNLWSVSGNILINGFVHVDGTVTANTASLRVEGDGTIWLEDIPVLGNVILYQGSWQLDGEAGATTTLNEVLSSLRIAGLDILGAPPTHPG